MENADDVLNTLRSLIDRQDLDCTFCRRLMSDPRNLNCGHSFCFDCIDGHINSTSEGDRFACPTCDVRHTVPSKLRKDLLLSTLIEARDILHEGATVRCTSCDHNRAAHACYTCSSFLCSRCHDNHMKTQLDEVKHESETMRNLRIGENFIRFQKARQSFCAHHPTNQNTLFCKYDEMAICDQCSKEPQHNGHYILEVLDQADAEIQQLTTKFLKFEEERRDVSRSLVLLKGKEKSLEQNATDLCDQIDHRVQELSRKVKEYGHKLKKEVNIKAESKIQTLQKQIEYDSTELETREKVLREIGVLHCMPMHGVLEVCRNIQRTADRCKDVPQVHQEELDKQFTYMGFTCSKMDDPFLVAAFKSLFGFVNPVTRADRKCNKPHSGMDQDMQREVMVCIHEALDGFCNEEYRPATFTKIAQKVCEKIRTVFKGRMWQCIAGTPGQLGFNIACSKDTMFTVVVGCIEIMLFYPKL